MLWHKEWGSEESGGWVESGAEEHPLELVKKLANHVATIADADVNHMRGKQRYRLKALSQGGESLGRHFFVLQGIGIDSEDDLEEIDDVSNKGLVRKLLETNSKLVAASQLGFGQIIDTQSRMLAKSQEHVERLLDQRMEAFVALEEARSLQHERMIDELKERASIEMKEKTFDSIKMLTPVVVNRLAGKPLLPAGDPKSMLVDDLLKSITVEQAQALASAGILSTEQLIVVMELIKDTNSENSSKEGN
jgi:hypothetical protein